MSSFKYFNRLNIDFGNRYLRALAALYIRMTFRAVEVYELLEPLLKDYRKIRYRNIRKLSNEHLAICVVLINMIFSWLRINVYGRIC